MNSISVNDLTAMAKNPENLAELGEKLYHSRIETAALDILNNRATRPVVLISGPSGSGKTTSAIRIAKILESQGCRAHTISMDDYFLPMSENLAAMDENGKIDFESPFRLDIKLFQSHLEKLFRGEEVEIPTFDFTEQERCPGSTLRREEGDIVIIEGIHALNPMVTGDSDNFTTRIYVSVRTRISDGEKLLHPSKIRLMRRLMRDKLYRGRSFSDTFEFFKSVERGENLYIMPFKSRANFDIDTFIQYEPLIYRDKLLPELEKTVPVYKDYGDYADIEYFLRLLPGIDSSYVPEHSLIREFIG